MPLTRQGGMSACLVKKYMPESVTFKRVYVQSCSSQSTKIRAERKHTIPTAMAPGVKRVPGIPARIPMGEDRTSPRTQQYVIRANLENRVSISRANR